MGNTHAWQQNWLPNVGRAYIVGRGEEALCAAHLLTGLTQERAKSTQNRRAQICSAQAWRRGHLQVLQHPPPPQNRGCGPGLRQHSGCKQSHQYAADLSGVSGCPRPRTSAGMAHHSWLGCCLLRSHHPVQACRPRSLPTHTHTVAHSTHTTATTANRGSAHRVALVACSWGLLHGHGYKHTTHSSPCKKTRACLLCMICQARRALACSIRRARPGPVTKTRIGAMQGGIAGPLHSCLWVRADAGCLETGQLARKGRSGGQHAQQCSCWSQRHTNRRQTHGARRHAPPGA